MADYLHIDFETFSLEDISVAGAYRYAEHPSTEILMMAWAFDDDPVQLWVPDPAKAGRDLPACVVEHIRRGGVVKAWNVQFEHAIWTHRLSHIVPLPTEQLYCTMTKALSLSYPTSLEACGKALGLSEDRAKLEEGKALIKRFCEPFRASKRAKERAVNRALPEEYPEEWRRFGEYCIRDVEAEREIDRRLPDWNYRGEFIEQHRLNLRMNVRGVPVDIPTVARLLDRVQEAVEGYSAELSRLTDGAITSISQRDRFLAHIEADLPDLKRDTVKKALDSTTTHDPLTRRLLEIRNEASRASISKYKAFLNTVGTDHRVRGTIQFYGASRTGRDAGRLIQPQNFIRPSMKPETIEEALHRLFETGNYEGNVIELAASALRSMIKATEGHKLAVADLAGIEARVVQWLAMDDEALRPFFEGLDVYKVMASYIFNTPYDQIDADQRWLGKTVILACGFGMGVPKFIASCEANGRTIPYNLAEKAVASFRRKHKKLERYWYDTERAAKTALGNANTWVPHNRVKWRYVATEGLPRVLLCRLPSGRYLVYPEPFIKGDAIHFYAYVNRKWIVESTYGGKLVENQTQATARDVMYNALHRVEEAGYKIFALVHDEVITEVEKNREGAGKELARMLTIPPTWGEGLPLGAEGYEAERYKKG